MSVPYPRLDVLGYTAVDTKEGRRRYGAFVGSGFREGAKEPRGEAKAAVANTHMRLQKQMTRNRTLAKRAKRIHNKLLSI